MATYYVSATTGNDSNDGSSVANAKATIGAGEDLATSAGDIVYIAPGTYREAISHGYSGAETNRIYFIGDPDCMIFGDAVTPGVIRVTDADVNEFASDTHNKYLINSNGRDHITWKNVHTDGVTGGVNAYNDANYGYGFRASSQADHFETINCMAQGLGYGFYRTYSYDCVSWGNIVYGFRNCVQVQNCISMNCTYGVYDCDYVFNSIIHGSLYAALYNDVVQNCMMFGSYYGFRGIQSSTSQPKDMCFDSIFLGNYYSVYGSNSTLGNGYVSGSFVQSSRYLGRYGKMHGMGFGTVWNQWQSSTYDPAIGLNGSTTMHSSGLLWPQKPMILYNIERIKQLKEVLKPTLYSKGIQGCTSTLTEQDLSAFDENMDMEAQPNITLYKFDIEGNPRNMGSTRGMYMEGSGHTTSSRDIGPFELSNIEPTGSYSSSKPAFKIEDEGIFRIPIVRSGSTPLTASIGVKHDAGTGTAVKPRFELRFDEEASTGFNSARSQFDSSANQLLSGSENIVLNAGVTSTAANDTWETITVSGSLTGYSTQYFDLVFINQQTGSDSISTFSDLEIL